MLDESMLEAPDSLARADRHGLLRGAAEAGARVRTALRNAEESGITALAPEGRPRSVLVAGAGAAAQGVSDVIDALAGVNAPVTRLRPTGVAPAAGALRWALPGWAGAVDLLLIATADGSEPGLGLLAEQAYRRGCTVVAVAPGGSPLGETVDGVRGLLVPMAQAPYETAAAAYGQDDRGTGAPPAGPADDAAAANAAPGTLWALLVPFLVLLDRIGLVEAPVAELQRVADLLDRIAERCGPAVGTHGNAAKTLAAELAESLPLIWTEGPTAAAVGRRFATVLAESAGRPALVAALPEALPAHDALLRGHFSPSSDLDDFFRDRVEEPQELRPRPVLLRDGQVAGLSAAPAAREAAAGRGMPVSELVPEDDTVLAALAELVAVTDFTAAYLAVAAV